MRLLQDETIDTIDEVYIVNRNFQNLDANKLDVKPSTITLKTFTLGSVLFIGVSSAIAENNLNFFWDNINNTLGIGTTTPSFGLHLFGSGDAAHMLVERNGGPQNFVANVGTAAILGTLNNFPLQIRTNNIPRINIETSGQVAIGSTFFTALARLHVQTGGVDVTPDGGGDEFMIEGVGTGVGMTIASPNTSQGFIFWADPESSVVGQDRYNHNTNAREFYTSGTLALRLETDQDLHVQPVGTADAEVEISDGNSTGGGDSHAANHTTHSEERLKSDLRLLTPLEYKQVYTTYKSFKHKEYRYKIIKDTTTYELVRSTSMPLTWGPTYDSAPHYIQHDRRGSKTLSLQKRATFTEMALRQSIIYIEELKQEMFVLKNRLDKIEGR